MQPRSSSRALRSLLIACLAASLVLVPAAAKPGGGGGHGGGKGGGGGPPSNTAPVAGFTYSCTDLACDFDASASSDAESSDAQLSFTWDFGDGDAGAGIAPTHTFAASGSYDVALTVTDPKGLSDVDTQTVTVTAPAPPPPPPPNSPPTASFTSMCTNLACAFDGAPSADAESPDDQLAYAWDFGDGNAATDISPQHEYGAGGTYTVTLTVTDPDGLSDAEAQSLTVDPPPPTNTPPTASFTFTCTDLACDLDGMDSSDPESSDAELGYAWDLGDGETAAGMVVRHSFATAGTYAVTLVVMDPGGLSDSVTGNVTVTAPPPPPANTPPTATFDTYCDELTCTFWAYYSDDAEDSFGQLRFSWDFGDGTTGSYYYAYHTYTLPGVYAVRLTVTDTGGLTDEASGQFLLPNLVCRYLRNGDVITDQVDCAERVIHDAELLLALLERNVRCTLANPGTNGILLCNGIRAPLYLIDYLKWVADECRSTLGPDSLERCLSYLEYYAEVVLWEVQCRRYSPLGGCYWD